MKPFHISDAKFAALAKYYDDPDGEQQFFWFDSDAIHELLDTGYLIEDSSYSVRLTDKGRRYIQRFRQRVESRNIQKMNSAQQQWLIRNRLNPLDANDRELMMDLLENARTKQTRETVIDNEAFRFTLSHDDWNRLAHNEDPHIRVFAADHADIEEFADETDQPTLLRAVTRYREEGRAIPHELVEGWYRNGNVSAAVAMDGHDLDVALVDGNVPFILQLVRLRKELFDTRRTVRVYEFAKTADDAVKSAVNCLLGEVNHLPEPLVRECADEKNMHHRLREYRDAYRRLKEMEALFEDPDCVLAREQRRLASAGVE